MKGSCNFLAVTSRLIHSCLIVIAVGPIRYTTADDSPAIVNSVTQEVFTLPNSPVWIEKEQSVYFVDASKGLLIRYQPNTDAAASTTPTVSVQLPSSANLKFLVPVISNETKFVTGYGSGVAVFAWNGESNQTLSPEIYLHVFGMKSESLECGKVDAKGQLWIGTNYLGDNGKKVIGRLYIITASGTVIPRDGSFNGLGGIEWSMDKKYMYYSDTTMNVVYRSSFNVNNDTITEGEVFYNFPDHGKMGSPSGMTLDADGKLWVACSRHSSQVLKLESINATVIKEVNFPETNSITDVGFRSNTDDLYVTTEENIANQTEYPKSGTLFHVTKTGSRGKSVSGIDVSKWPKA